MPPRIPRRRRRRPWLRGLAVLLLVSGLALVGLIVIPSNATCTERCAGACPGDHPVLSLCIQRCRLGCFWGEGQQLAEGLSSGNREVKIGDRRITVPEVHMPLEELVEAATELEAPSYPSRTAESAAVDLRGEMRRRGIAIHDQRSTETCMAQALTSAMEFALVPKLRDDPGRARRVGAPLTGPQLSRKHAYAQSLRAAGLCTRKHEGSWVLQAASAIHDEGTYLERFWPWSVWDPTDARFATCEEAVYGGTPAPGADAARHFFIDEFAYLPPFGWSSSTARSVDDLEGILDAGHPVVLSVFLVVESWDRAAVERGLVRPPSSPLKGWRGAHYVLLVGFDRREGHFVFANSWGADFGIGGYGAMSYDYVKRYAIEGLVVRSMRIAEN